MLFIYNFNLGKGNAQLLGYLYFLTDLRDIFPIIISSQEKKSRLEEIIQSVLGWPGWEWYKCISIRSALWDWRGTILLMSVAQNASEGRIGVCSNAPMKELLLVNYIYRLISAFPCNILNHLRTISTLETYLAMLRIMVGSKLKHCLCYPPGTQPSGKVAFFMINIATLQN